jgi:hypothetical protein
MATAKDIILRPIPAKQATELIKRVHYSGKVVQNSQIHIGVFLGGQLEGAMQFGPSLDKRKIQGLVKGTGWNDFIELNRMAFTDALPRNSESRAIGIAMKLLKKHAPQLRWVISFADACQCGDGTIYRASGFVLTGIKENAQNYKLPFAENLDPRPLLAKGLTSKDIDILRAWLDQITPHKMSLQSAPHAHKMSLEGGCRPSALLSEVKQLMRVVTGGGTSADKLFRLMGGVPAVGYQLRYIYFLDPTARQNLTVPEVPFSRIAEMGARMYKGHAVEASDHPDQGQGDGAAPILPLQDSPITKASASLRL